MKLKTLLLVILGSVLFWLMVSPALAAIQLPGDLKPNNLPVFVEPAEAISEDHPETAATQTLILFVGKMTSRVLIFAGAIAVFSLILSTTHYILAFGKDARITKGKNGMFWALIGLLIILLSYAIVQAILSLALQVDSSLG